MKEPRGGRGAGGGEGIMMDTIPFASENEMHSTLLNHDNRKTTKVSLKYFFLGGDKNSLCTKRVGPIFFFFFMLLKYVLINTSNINFASQLHFAKYKRSDMFKDKESLKLFCPNTAKKF